MLTIPYSSLETAGKSATYQLLWYFIIRSVRRGIIQCLKLSPNLRKQTKEVKAAFVNKDAKKALELEVKKLEVLLAMVREPEENSTMKKEEEHHWNRAFYPSCVFDSTRTKRLIIIRAWVWREFMKNNREIIQVTS